MKHLPNLGHVDQLGYVVEDITAGVEHWLHVMGVGPFFVMRGVGIDGAYEGDTPQPIAMDIAFSYLGDTQIELIRPLGENPSPYRTFARAHGGNGLHHIARFTDDYATDLAAIRRATGPVRLFHAATPAGRLAYIEGDQPDGPVLELVETNTMHELYTAIRDAVDTWDGTRPVREISPSGIPVD
jgi:methylmalonyl-CoA/ethylmalonyl-CoA epimerase